MSPLELAPQQLNWPTNWSDIFGRTAPLVIEVGFGNANFLINLAQKRPEANVIGLEISLPSIYKAVSKGRQAGLTNLRILQADAKYVLQALCAPQTIDHLFINFPDPWPKERHHDRRLINEKFLRLLATRMIPGGLLDIAMDHPDYIPWTTDCLLGNPYFQSRLDTPFVTTDVTRLVTKYELKAKREGRTSHYYKWHRNHHPAPSEFAVPEEQPMPHVICRSPLSLADVAAQFEPMSAVALDRSIHITLLELFQSAEDGKLLVESYLKERPLEQRVAIKISQRDTGDWVIRLHEVGFPRPTPGGQLAIARLATWIASLHPATEIVHSNLPDAIMRAVGMQNVGRSTTI